MTQEHEKTAKNKVLFLITKEKWGKNENYFSFFPVVNKVSEQPLSNRMRQAVGGPTQLRIESA